MKPRTQAESARLSVAGELHWMAKRAMGMAHGCVPVPGDDTDYWRERARLLRVALRAVERAK